MSFDNTQPPLPPQGSPVPPPAGPSSPPFGAPPAPQFAAPPAPQLPPTGDFVPPHSPGFAPAPAGPDGKAPEGDKSFVTAWLLSWFLGLLGMDRFYLGKVGTGLIKLFTFGGIGVWWLIDVILVLTGATRDRRGFALAGYQKYKKIAWIVTGAFVVLGLIINGVNSANGAGKPAAETPTTVAGTPSDDAAEEQAEAPVETQVAVPDVVGSTVGEARTALEAAGLVLTVPDGAGDDWVVATQSVAAETEAEAGSAVSVTASAPAPKLTLEQENALGKAEQYLAAMGFSRTGLIGQLEFEGFPTDVATFAADNSGADWNAEAAEKAKQYLDAMSFSREGLYDQMAFEGFTPEQIDHALAAVGY